VEAARQPRAAPRADPTASDAALLRSYHETGDIRARQELIERHLPLVHRLAQRYSRRGEAAEDLAQVGVVGLIKAIDRFDGGYGVSLPTYAAPNILGEIKRHFRDRGWAMRVPRDIQELNVRLHRAMDALTVKLGRSPRVEELARETGTSPEQVLEALESSSAYSTISLSERPPGEDDDGGSNPLDAVGDDDPGYERSEDRLMLRTTLRHLPARERQILHLRFFEGLTQSEIAERIGVSQMHVSRLIRDSLARMRRQLEQGGRPSGRTLE